MDGWLVGCLVMRETGLILVGCWTDKIPEDSCRRNNRRISRE